MFIVLPFVVFVSLLSSFIVVVVVVVRVENTVLPFILLSI